MNMVLTKSKTVWECRKEKTGIMMVKMLLPKANLLIMMKVMH